MHLGFPTKPSEAGLLGKGGARKRAQFSPLGGNGVERTLQRRAAVDKVGRRRGGEISPSLVPPQRTDPWPADENPLLTISPPGDIVPLSNRHGRRRTRRASPREGRTLVQAPCDGGGRYHSRAARDDRDGPARYSGHKRPDVTLHTLRDGQLLYTPPKMPPGFARPVFRSACIAVVLLPGAPRFWQAGWNRGA